MNRYLLEFFLRYRKIMVILIILCPTYFPAQSQNKYEVFFDDFINNEQHWAPMGDRMRSKSQIIDGYFYLESKSRLTGFYRRTMNAFLKEDDEYEIEIKFRQAKGNNDKGYALEWGGNSVEKKVYQFWLRNDGYYAIASFDGYKETYQDFVPWTYSELVFIDTFNIVKIQRLKDTFTYVLNGKQIFSMKALPVFGTEVGFLPPPSAAIKVDFLRISLLNRKPKSSIDKDLVPNIWVVIAGVAEYQDENIPNLNFTTNDAYSLADFYKHPSGGSIPSENLILLTNEKATKENILNALNKNFQKAKEKDLIVFYFSGHGLINEKTNNQFYLLPYDYVSENWETAIYYNEIKELFLKSRANRKLWIMDACHSGAAISKLKNMSVDSSLAEIKDTKIALLTSSNIGEESLEIRSLERGLFSYYLTEGLLNESPRIDNNRDQFIDIYELFSYAQIKTSARAFNIQNPQIAGTFNVNLPLGKVKNLKKN